MRIAGLITALCAASSIAAAQTQPPHKQAPQKQPPAIVVPAPPTVPAPAPKADPRTITQQIRDRRAFGRCLLAAQNRQAQDNAFQPGFEDPLERCRRLTSMQNADAPPTARK